MASTEQTPFFRVFVLGDAPTIGRLRLDHLGEAARVEDPRTGATLLGEPPLTTAIGDVAIGAGPGLLFGDGFESGDLSAWSSGATGRR